MTTSIGRITRLAVGVIAAALGIVLLIVDAPAASAGGGMTVHLKQSSVTEYDGCSGFTGAYFVITDLKGDAPASITVTLSDSSTQVVPLLANDGGSAHYSMTVDLTAVRVTDATAVVPSGWSGQFNISHCLSATTPPVTTTTVTAPPTTVTRKTTQQTTHVGMTTATTAATRTVTSQTVQTVTSQMVQTVTSPVTRTVTRQIQVAGTSSAMSSRPSTTQSSMPSSVQVLGESSSLAPAPSANAHTGQGWGILPYLLFGGGVLLALTGLRVRRGRAH